MVFSIFHDYPFLIPIVVMFLAEVVKWINEGIRNGRIFRHGGMPSSHSAFVASLLIIVWRLEGTASAAFAIAVVFACIVWYDAAFIRSQVGKQGKVLNILQNFQKFSEHVGHSALEVLAGIAFGIVVTWVGISLS